MRPAPIGTRDRASMETYARGARVVELEAVLGEARRDGDRELVEVLELELERRGA